MINPLYPPGPARNKKSEKRTLVGGDVRLYKPYYAPFAGTSIRTIFFGIFFKGVNR